MPEPLGELLGVLAFCAVVFVLAFARAFYVVNLKGKRKRRK